MKCSIYVVKTKALISCMVNLQLMCSFVFTYANSRFSHAVAQKMMMMMTMMMMMISIFSGYGSVQMTLFDLLYYVHLKQLRSCRDGQLLNHTVPGQASKRQFTSIKYPSFHQ